MISLIDRAARRVREAQLRRAAAGILATPPIRGSDDGVILFSMIGTRVLLPYLVAVKSLHARLGRGRVAILDDGTLTAADKALLAEHCDNPPITPIAAVDTGPCQRGGTWERLLTILDLRRAAYVIQLDSDTVTLGPVPEITGAIAAGRSFTLRGGDDSALLRLDDAAAYARAHRDPGKDHMQWAIEAALDGVRIANRGPLNYVRGCSGFAGFAPSTEGRGLAEAFSAEAARLIGPRWHEWGSEQVTSNFVIANAADPLLLPHRRYLNYWRQTIPGDAALVHFLGTNRYHAGLYAKAVQRVIGALRRG